MLKVDAPRMELSSKGPSWPSSCSGSVLPRLDNQRFDNRQAAFVRRAVSCAHEVRHVQNGSGDHIDMVPVK